MKTGPNWARQHILVGLERKRNIKRKKWKGAFSRKGGKVKGTFSTPPPGGGRDQHCTPVSAGRRPEREIICSLLVPVISFVDGACRYQREAFIPWSVSQSRNSPPQVQNPKRLLFPLKIITLCSISSSDLAKAALQEGPGRGDQNAKFSYP